MSDQTCRPGFRVNRQRSHKTETGNGVRTKLRLAAPISTLQLRFGIVEK
jgi:hypothetical protein